MNAPNSRKSDRGRALSALVLVAVCLLNTACDGGLGGDRIREMELRLEGGVATFVIPEHDWLAPFSKPTITEFAVASADKDEVVWQLASETEGGVPARGLAITFGAMSPGFLQVVPDEASRPKPLVAGRNYFVAAGGATHVYRLIFAMPVSLSRPAPTPTTAPTDEAFPRKDLWDKMKSTSQPAEQGPAEAPGMPAEPGEEPGMQPNPAEAPATEEIPAEAPEEAPKRPSIFGE